MKKFVSYLLLAVMLISSTTILSGCFLDSKSKNTTETKPTETKKITYTLQDYYDDYIEGNYEDLNVNQGMMNIFVYVKDDTTLVYEYTYTSNLPVTDTTVSLLEENFESVMPIFKDTLSDIKDKTGIENPVITVRYLNDDSSVIFEKDVELGEEQSTEGTSSNDYNTLYSLEDFVNSPSIQNTASSLESAFNGDITVSVFEEDGNIVYALKYTNQIPEDTVHDISTAMETALDDMKSEFNNLVQLVRSSVNDADYCSVYIRILNADDTLITEKVYTGD